MRFSTQTLKKLFLQRSNSVLEPSRSSSLIVYDEKAVQSQFKHFIGIFHKVKKTKSALLRD